MADIPEQNTEKPKRRVRYSGTHPRRFSEKYKELNPDKYPDTVAHVLASGKTPAGMHRPIMVREILEWLQPRSGQVGVDCTLGYGGHAREILNQLRPGGKLIGIDTDPIELARTEERLSREGYRAEELITRNTNFAALPRLLGELRLPGVDFILADLGVSSMQLDTPERGFSYKFDAPLDLRMNPNKGRPASAVLTTLSEQNLIDLLRENSDEEFAPAISRAILAGQKHSPIATTRALRHAIESGLKTIGRAANIELAIRRTFQAIRILVNDEFGVLDQFLRALPDCLNPGGRVAILTFHSGEDRRVKKRFQELERSGIFSRTTGPLTAGPEERHQNPRSSSAKLRCAEKMASTSTR